MKDNIRPDLLDRVFDLSTVEDVTSEEADLMPDSLNTRAVAPENSGNGPPLRQGKLSQIGSEETTDARDETNAHLSHATSTTRPALADSYAANTSRIAS